MRALRSGLPALLLVLGAALAAMWLSGATPPVAHIGNTSIQQGTSSADGI